MEISFSEFRSKMVVNLTDGRRLGHVIDLIFDQNSAKISGVIVPGGRGGFFKSKEDLFIPYQYICKIGLDTILVQLNPINPTVNGQNINNSNYSQINSAVRAETVNNDKNRKYVVYSPENY